MIKYGLMISIELKSSSNAYIIKLSSTDKQIDIRDMVVPSLLPDSNASSLSSLSSIFEIPEIWSASSYFSFFANYHSNSEDQYQYFEEKKLKADGFLPFGVFPSLVSKLLRYVNEQVPHQHKYDGLFQDQVTFYMGNQLIRLTVDQDMHSILMEVSGKNPNPIIVHHRVYGIINEVIHQITKALNCIPLLKYNDDCFIDMNVISGIIKKGRKLRLFRGLMIDAASIREKFPLWIREYNNVSFDLFISYRLKFKDSEGDDSSFTAVLFDQMNMQSIGDNNEFVSVFLDKMVLEDADQFQERFCECLLKSKVIIPILSSDALQRMMIGKVMPEKNDNLLIEWILSLEMAKRKKLKIFPILIGAKKINNNAINNSLNNDDVASSSSLGYLNERNDFWSSNLLDKLSAEIPTKSIITANKILMEREHDAPAIAERSVKDIVNELSLHNGWDFSSVAPKHAVETVVEKVMEILYKMTKNDDTLDHRNKSPNKNDTIEKSHRVPIDSHTNTNSNSNTNNCDNMHANSLYIWLNSIYLVDYYNHFVDCGLTDMEFLLNYKTSNNKVDKDGIMEDLQLEVMKKPHVRMFLTKLEEYYSNRENHT